MEFYKYIYYNVYKSSKKVNATPEISVIGLISHCQINNLLTVLNLLFFFTRTNDNYDIPKCYLVGIIVLFAANYYYYESRNNKRGIIENHNYNLGKYTFLCYVYLGLSVFLAGFTYYIYKEW
ncbi:hypothetical protein [Flavobacterium sp. GT3R68]|uniref:hypothetical protein n=1 Tax=Flavobacterium sp. GT3R68 TaxID=2594437 RepID=UPI000F898D82|nr:hypothetical protein [Flavobacterium sp. GT3R68]RTY91332.1 hypothetical protein EKL32_19070 [Flavobacterium sp. GSN2]TRW93958.1 hypothetical protein FNW07_03335 [Flavobacterium sp. GT3R68]